MHTFKIRKHFDPAPVACLNVYCQALSTKCKNGTYVYRINFYNNF